MHTPPLLYAQTGADVKAENEFIGEAITEMVEAVKDTVADLGKTIVKSSASETVKSVKGVGKVAIDSTIATLKTPNAIGGAVFGGV